MNGNEYNGLLSVVQMCFGCQEIESGRLIESLGIYKNSYLLHLGV